MQEEEQALEIGSQSPDPGQDLSAGRQRSGANLCKDDGRRQTLETH